MAAFTTVDLELSPSMTESLGNAIEPARARSPTMLAQQVAQQAIDASQEPEASMRQVTSGLAGQHALPVEGLTSSQAGDGTQQESQSLKRAGPEREDRAQDVDMGEGEDEQMADEDDSDNDSVTSDSQRPSKKKKGQRFFCTDFPPCTLSFTRSEHLARHIRKHTGERPFVCHCSRRFSRLDNLRQHAQTVHVNEDIPGDSLAATSTRFQRQIRTDRVRPAGNRSRTNTLNSSGGHSRGHSRNLSTSSIGSTASSVSIAEDTRRRPQPIAIANEPSGRRGLAIDTYNNAATSPQYAYYNQSPTGFSTPTSTTFSTMGPESPRFGSGMASPASTISRSSFYNGARHARRLSVPSSHMQVQYQSGFAQPMYYGPTVGTGGSNYSQQSSVFGSPTSSVFSHGRRDSEAELDYRRRTWHSGTYGNYAVRPATSGLSYHQTPDDQRPAFSGQPAASQVTRLPGIESFDHAPPANARQPASPMITSTSPCPPSGGRPSDAGLHNSLTRLDLTTPHVPSESQWQMQQQPPSQHVYVQQQPATMAPQSMHHHSNSMPEPITPRRAKRQAWYGGPVTPTNTHGAHRPSPEDSGSSDGVPTPGTSQGAEFHPVIIGSGEQYPVQQQQAAGMAEEQHNDKVAHHVTSDQSKPEPARADSGYQPFGAPMMPPPQAQTYALQRAASQEVRFAPSVVPQQASSDMSGLEALVAAAERS